MPTAIDPCQRAAELLTPRSLLRTMLVLACSGQSEVVVQTVARAVVDIEEPNRAEVFSFVEQGVHCAIYRLIFNDIVECRNKAGIIVYRVSPKYMATMLDHAARHCVNAHGLDVEWPAPKPAESLVSKALGWVEEQAKSAKRRIARGV